MEPLSAQELLRPKVSELGLSPHAHTVLVQLAVDTVGWEHTAAPSFVASYLGVDLERAGAVIAELLGTQAVVLTCEGGSQRLRANYKRLAIDKATQQQLHLARPLHTDLGPPHSPEAMARLAQMIRETTGTLFLGAEATSPTVFSGLGERAERRRDTVVLLPKRNAVPGDLQPHYDEMLQAWVKWIVSGPRVLRDHLHVRLMSRPFPDLYTTALSTEEARVNLRAYQGPSTRLGHMLTAPRNTSLYGLIRSRYELAYRTSVPLWPVWRYEWSLHWLKRVLLPLALLGVTVAFSLMQGRLANAGIAIGATLFGAFVADPIREGLWKRDRLFGRSSTGPSTPMTSEST